MKLFVLFLGVFLLSLSSGNARTFECSPPPNSNIKLLHKQVVGIDGEKACHEANSQVCKPPGQPGACTAKPVPLKRPY